VIRRKGVMTFPSLLHLYEFKLVKFVNKEKKQLNHKKLFGGNYNEKNYFIKLV